jgi:hypothetical protein
VVIATIKVQDISSGQDVGREAVVCIDVQTNVWNCVFPFSVDDQGRDQANEHQARRELQVFPQDALQALG